MLLWNSLDMTSTSKVKIKINRQYWFVDIYRFLCTWTILNEKPFLCVLSLHKLTIIFYSSLDRWHHFYSEIHWFLLDFFPKEISYMVIKVHGIHEKCVYKYWEVWFIASANMWWVILDIFHGERSYKIVGCHVFISFQFSLWKVNIKWIGSYTKEFF